MIKLRVETVARDGRPTLPGKVNFKKRGEEIGCQGTGSTSRMVDTYMDNRSNLKNNSKELKPH
jgi:hypothetical protein